MIWHGRTSRAAHNGLVAGSSAAGPTKHINDLPILIFSAPPEIPTQSRSNSSKIEKSSQRQLRQAGRVRRCACRFLSEHRRRSNCPSRAHRLIARNVGFSLNGGPSATLRSCQLCAMSGSARSFDYLAARSDCPAHDTKKPPPKRGARCRATWVLNRTNHVSPRRNGATVHLISEQPHDHSNNQGCADHKIRP
jgi:hypothetical protein